VLLVQSASDTRYESSQISKFRWPKEEVP
jgi:hypothetical protein